MLVEIVKEEYDKLSLIFFNINVIQIQKVVAGLMLGYYKVCNLFSVIAMIVWRSLNYCFRSNSWMA